MSSKSTKLLASTLGVISALSDTPYSIDSLPSIKSKPIVGTYNITKCRVCNRSNITLYKEKSGTMICKNCKSIENQGGDSYDS